MDAARWQRVSGIFEEAVGLPPHERDRFLETACGDDPDLRREVESLLAAHTETGLPIDRPAMHAAPELVEEAPTLAPGERIGSYVVEREIARGGMGIVYRAIDERLGRPVALKAVSPAASRSTATRERLRREARAAAMLSHPSIATVYALEERGDDLFIVSELLEGRTLRARLNDGPMPPTDAIHIGLQLAQGLAAAHARGIVHRDLKPENVMLVGERTIKILDFGIARIDAADGGPSLTVSGLLLGTPGYMAPEQLRGEPVDARTDLFALGAVLYELVTGKAPFGRGATPSVVAAALERDPPPIDEIIEHAPEPLAQVIERCLEKQPADRFQGASDVVSALEAIPRADTGARAAAVEAPPPRGRQVWWWRFHETAAAVAHWTMLIPAWQLVERLPANVGRVMFVILAGAASATGVLRLHLAFIARHDPGRLESGLARFGGWIRWGDRVFAALLAIGGLTIAGTAAGLGALLVALAVGSLVASHVVEPSTAESALRALRRPAPRRTSFTGRDP